MKRLLLLLFLFATPLLAQNSYETNFPLTQNPMSENSKWIQGGTIGLDWGNVQTTPGKVFGVSLPPASQYTDPTAALSGTWSPSQWARGVVFKVGSLTTQSKEVELRLRTKITAHTITGYEMLCNVIDSGSATYGMQIVRWNGPLANSANTNFGFTILAGTGSPVVTCSNGDVLFFTATGSNPTVLTGYKNGVQVMTVNDTNADGHAPASWPFVGSNTGAPGVGFYNNPGGDWSNFGLSDFRAGDTAGTILPSADCNQASVSTQITAAAAGDIVLVPGGSCTWSGTKITIAKNLSIIGTGESNLTITDSQCQMFQFNPTTVGSLTRLSGMTIAWGSGTCAPVKAQGTCNTTDCTYLRLDHLTFNGWAPHCCAGNNNSLGLTAVGDFFGVLDHNTINGQVGNSLTLVELNHASFPCPVTTCSFGSNVSGDASYALSEFYGSNKFLFIENNTFLYSVTTDNEGWAGLTQGTQGGGRVVVRFNQFQSGDGQVATMGWHGTESSGRSRSTRAFEYYGNTVTYDAVLARTGGPVAYGRGGTGLVWGNSVFVPPAVSAQGSLYNNTYYRYAGRPSTPWVQCDGSQAWDTNDGPSNVATVYFSGTLDTVPSGFPNKVLTMLGTSPGWTTNQWVGYSVHDVTLSSGGMIVASGANTLTIQNPGGPGQYTPVTGDSIQILRVFACIDQGGRGAGTYYGGVATPSTASNEVLSPVYGFNNTSTGKPLGGIIGAFPLGPTQLQQNVEYYQETVNQGLQTTSSAPFTGNPGTGPGVGQGIKSRRPATCTTGVGYWATDEGNWDVQLTGGVQGNLYLCTTTNTWTLSYTPYTYPHPLISGLTAPTTPIASVSPGSLTFANQNIGTTSAAQTVTLTNVGSLPLALTQIAISGNYGETDNCSLITPLAPSAFCTFQVSFSPASAGVLSGTLIITDNSGNVPGSTQTVNLSGTGVNPAPIISLAPPSLTFSTNKNTTSAAQTITVQNNGGSNLVGSYVFTGAFSRTGGTCVTPYNMAPTASCTVNVVFSPNAAGAFPGALTFSDNSTGSPHAVSLSGTGTTPVVQLLPASYSFPNTSIGNTQTSANFTLTNTGNGPLLISLTIGGAAPVGIFQVYQPGTTCAGTLAAGNSCTIVTSFSPAIASAYTGTVVETDSGQAVSGTSTLAGTGIAAVPSQVAPIPWIL